MKIIILSIILFCFVGCISATNYPENNAAMLRTTFKFNTPEKSKKKAKTVEEGGFYFNFGLAIPSRNMYVMLDTVNNSSERYSSGISIEVGNSFHLAPISEHAIGLKVTWLKANYNTYSKTSGSYTYYSNYIQGSLLRLGPYFSYNLKNDMMIDGFYQVGPTYCYDTQVKAIAPPIIRTYAGYYGVTHNLGFDFRYKFLYAGIDFNFGRVKYADKTVLKTNLNISDKDYHDSYTIRSSYSRIFFGLHF
jgi:hypothetical protein